MLQVQFLVYLTQLWIKQVLANRPDIVREDYMIELCILQDDVPPFPNQVHINILSQKNKTYMPLRFLDGHQQTVLLIYVFLFHSE